MKFFASACLQALFLLIAAAPAPAHRAHLFAAVQDGVIVADCRFSKKSPARNARVEVFDAASGRLLASGASDSRGAARIPLPPELAARPADLLLVLDAGEGHRAEWRIKAKELREAKAVVAAPSEPAAAPVAANPQCISPEELDARLREQEARLRAERNAQGPGPTEIIGGLGWIAGIFSLVAALMRRHRKGRA